MSWTTIASAILFNLVFAWLCTSNELPAAAGSGGPSPHSNAAACSHPLYCNNSLLCSVQTAGLFADSKTFVDLPLRPGQSLADVLAGFDALGPAPSSAGIAAWLARHFQEAGADLETWTPPDWTATPALLEQIADAQLRAFASGLVGVWPSLGRRTNASYAQPTPLLQETAGTSSLLQVPNGFIVPGGRFREYYYWDTYFIVQGLLASDMLASSRGVVDNFLSLVDSVGFVPNGGRVYYMNRSQPPMLTLMVREYWRRTADLELLRRALPSLLVEYRFWQQRRAVVVAGHQLNVYGSSMNVPRPEGWLEDVTLAQNLTARLDAARRLWHNVAAAAETGWDFSSRWCAVGADLSTLRTTTIVPVDLNAILFGVETALADFHAALGQPADAAAMLAAAERRKRAIEALLWSPRHGCWLDYDVDSGAHVDKTFYVSNVLPLWTGAYDPSPERSQQIVDYLTTVTGALAYPGGVPTSLDRHSALQWDYPNAWPPEQLFVVEGLQRLPFAPAAQQLAFDLAQQWVSSNYLAWNASGGMFEKYNATQPGLPGGGGEYPTQLGFGWSNGVVLHLMQQYGDRLTAPTASATVAHSSVTSTTHLADVLPLLDAAHSMFTLPHRPNIDPIFCPLPTLLP